MFFKILKRNLIRRCFKHYFEPYFYQNINIDFTNPKQPRALICYLTEPLSYGKECFSLGHTNMLESGAIIKEFINLGFCVDVINCGDENQLHLKSLASKHYDVILGSPPLFHKICQQNPQALKIIYLTEAAPDALAENERARIDYFQKRHGMSNVLIRAGAWYKNEHISIADFGILLGGKWTQKTYSDFFPDLTVCQISATGLLNDNMSIDKLGNGDKHNFIWMGSKGAILRGVDVLLDVFSELPAANLFLCGLAKEEKILLNKYRDFHNIIDMDFMRIGSDDFLNLVTKCRFAILPSGSEGMSTSGLTCMRHGLIPLYTRQTGIDLLDMGLVLEDYSVEYIKEVVSKVIAYPDDLLNDMQLKVYQYANKNFCLESYQEKLDIALKEILEKSNLI